MASGLSKVLLKNSYPLIFRNDKQIILTAVKTDREVILADVHSNGLALKYANKFKTDKEVVLTAVKQNGIALQYASEDLTANKEVVLTAVHNNGLALQCANKFKTDREVILAAVQQNGLALEYADKFQIDKEIVLAAVQQNGYALEYAYRFQRNREIVLAAVNSSGCSLQYASYDLINDKEIVLAAVKENSYVLKYVSIKNKHILIDCYRINKKVIYTNDFIKQFNMLENGQFDDSFIENNADILHLVENKEQLYQYLLNNKINIVHDNQELALDIINNNRIIVLSYSVIDPEK